ADHRDGYAVAVRLALVERRDRDRKPHANADVAMGDDLGVGRRRTAGDQNGDHSGTSEHRRASRVGELVPAFLAIHSGLPPREIRSRRAPLIAPRAAANWLDNRTFWIWHPPLNLRRVFAIRPPDLLTGEVAAPGRSDRQSNISCAAPKRLLDQGFTDVFDLRHRGQYHLRDLRHPT